MKHTDIVEILTNRDKYANQEVTICGWVRTIRNSKNVCFLEINDGTCLKNIQLIVDKASYADTDLVHQNVGASITATGVAVPAYNDNTKLEINVTSATVLGECPNDYPLQKKRHTLEYLRTIPHLRLRTNTFSAVFRIRNQVAKSIHSFYQERGFVYANTPIITGSDCEGAGEIFKVTTIGYNPEYKSEEEYNANDFFGRSAGLTVSGQLEGEAMAMAFQKIYTFGPTFRAENSNTARHAAEFWQIEPEVAFADLNDIMKLAEAMVKRIVSDALEFCPDEIDFFQKHYEEGLVAKLRKIIDNEFAILDYTEAINILEKSGRKFQYPVFWGCDLQTEHERYLTDEVYNKPLFVINYPKEIKSFYMKLNPDNKTVAAADLLVPGVGEIIGSSERENDYNKLSKRIDELKMKREDYEWYLDLRKFGSAPHSGFGLGLERMIMYLTGIGNIRDTEIYPRTKGFLA